MADRTYGEVYAMNAEEARRRLIQTYTETGSISETARWWNNCWNEKRRSNWDGRRKCCATTRRPIQLTYAASTMTWKLAWATCAACCCSTRRSVPQPAGACLPGEPQAQQADPSLLH